MVKAYLLIVSALSVIASSFAAPMANEVARDQWSSEFFSRLI